MPSLTKVEQLVHHSTEIDILDFKRQLPNTLDKAELAELVRDIIALANAAYDSGDVTGYLVYGIEDGTRMPVDISGQIIQLKPKEAKAISALSCQGDIDAYNQRNLVRVVKDHIKGYRERRLILRYGSEKHPDDPSSLVGLLRIVAQHGPYVVKKKIDRVVRNGKTIDEGIKPDQSWIRDGEDKRPIYFNELTSMNEAAKEKQRQLRRIERATRDLGEVVQRWGLSLVETPVEERPTLKLITRPLQTRSQLDCCFHQPPKLTEHLHRLGSMWYLNHLVISSPPGSGRTTLLSYLIFLRSVAKARGCPIRAHRIPSSPNLDEFIAYIDRVLGKEVPVGTDRTFVFDLPLVQDNQLQLIQMLGKAFPKMRYCQMLWIGRS